MRFFGILITLPALLLVFHAFPVVADPLEDAATDPFPPARPLLGQPDRVRINWGPLTGYEFERREHDSRVFGSLTMRGPFGNYGLGDLSWEVAVGHAGEELDAATGLYVKIPWLRAGAEYSLRQKEVLGSLVAEIALRRGGLLQRGDELRIEYRPANRQLLVGFSLPRPLRTYRMTRPIRDHARLPRGRMPAPPRRLESEPLPPGLVEAIERVEAAVMGLDRLLTPRFQTGTNFDRGAERYRDRIRQPGGSFWEQDSAYHRELDRAFALAAGNDAVTGHELARIAESVLLESVLVPFNRLFGQNKSPYNLNGYAQDALAAMGAHLREHPHFATLTPVMAERQQALASEVFRRVLSSVNRVARDARTRWQQYHLFWLYQSRLVWLPLNYGLRPADYDTQNEWNALLGRFLEQDVTEANTVSYLLTEQFHREMVRMVRETDSYQVTIIHDFRGRTETGSTDEIGWDLVIDGYLAAFSQAVRDLDAGARNGLPQFILFLDENYYHVNKARRIITFLESLLEAPVPDLDEPALQSRLQEARDQLRGVVAQSRALRELSAQRRRELFRIQVHVTNPYDPCFASDVAYRDHRKIAFRDISESDPSSGVAVFTGQGVGEHYYGPDWDDRSIRIAGASLVALKTEARRLLQSQGFDPDEVPPCLQARSYPPDYDARCADLIRRGWTTPMLLSFNQTGYGSKLATAFKAVVYNLMPAGSLLLCPDSLWISEYWAGMLISAALRGVHVLPFCPSPKNAPSAGAFTLYLMHQNMDLLLQAKTFFAEEIHAAGGMLLPGVYTQKFPVHDLRSQLSALVEMGVGEGPLCSLIPLDTELLACARKILETQPAMDLDALPTTASGVRVDSKHPPRLHLKVQLLTTAAAWPGPAALEGYLAARLAQIRGEASTGITPSLMATTGETQKRGISILLVGSHNQDRRSMLADGEAIAGVLGDHARMASFDLLFLLAATEWPADRVAFETLFPEPEGPGWVKRSVWLLKDLF